MIGRVLDRTTFQVIEGVDLDRYNQTNWIHNPNLSQVFGWDKRYWKIIPNPYYNPGDDSTSGGGVLPGSTAGTNGIYIPPTDFVNTTDPELIVIMDPLERLLVDGKDYFKIYEYIVDIPTNLQQNPVDIPYDIHGLIKKKTFIDGELVRVDYYGSYDLENDVYSDLVIREDRAYWRRDGMVLFREMRIQWFMKSEQIGTIKMTRKYYEVDESYAEGEARRQNVVTTLKINTVGLIAMTEGISISDAENIGKPFLAEANEFLVLFVSGVEEPLGDFFITANGDFPWLENQVPGAPDGYTIRLYLYNQIQFDYFKYDLANYDPSQFRTPLINPL